MLTLSKQNSKLNELAKSLGLKRSQVISIDLPAGFTCPAAALCQTYANRHTGKQTKGRHHQFSCYASDLEARYKNVRAAHWRNWDALVPHMKDPGAMADIIDGSIPDNVRVVRIHSSGDFFNKEYYQAWVIVATRRPDVIFFGYTKVYPLLKESRPDNLKLVYSHGGTFDDSAVDVPTSYVVKDAQEARDMALPVACPTPTDPSDYEFILSQRSFAIILH